MEPFGLYDDANIPNGALVKYICPTCKTDKLTVYRVEGYFETGAYCHRCQRTAVIHAG